MAEMADQARIEFLREVRVGVLSMERADDAPMSAPVWYWLTDDGTFQIAMANASAKARLLRRSGRATLCVQAEDYPYRYVTASGPVEVAVASDAERNEIILFMASRYLGEEGGQRYADNFPGHEEAIVTLRPDRWRSELLG